MKKILIFILATAMLCSLAACSARKKADEESVQKLKDAIADAENAGINGSNSNISNNGASFFYSEFEEYGYYLKAGKAEIPIDKTEIRAAISLIEWWCDPSALLEEGAEPAYRYEGICLVNDTEECYLFSYGYMEYGEFIWKREFATDFGATKIFELNVKTLKYIELYSAKS